MQEFEGHKLGRFHKLNNIAYINIPKCGSTSLKTALTGIGFTEVAIENEPLGEAFAIVRNPLSRFVSGAAERYERREERVGYLDWLRETYAQVEVTGDPVLDEHTQPQVDFLRPYKRDIEFIPFPFLKAGVDNFFAEHGLEAPPIRTLHRTPRPWHKLAVELLTADLVSIVASFYKEDWVLYRRACDHFLSRNLLD